MSSNFCSVQKVLLLGLDAATFDIINPLIGEGVLPNIEHLLKDASSATLLSVRPPNSAAAWPSVYTGLTPGQHGVCDFRMRQRDSYTPGVVRSHSVHGHRLWDLLAQHGKSSGIVNCPITYPPSPVNGYMISGLLTPHYGSEFTYPQSLKRELEESRCPWPLEVRNLQAMSIAAAIERTTEYTRSHTRALRHLMRTHDWDFLLTVYRAVDVLQHVYFDDESFNGNPPGLVGEKGEAIRRGYIELDRAVGEILSDLPPRTTVITLSDHGMSIVRRRFHVNQWLEQEGYLRRRWHLRPVALQPARRQTVGRALKAMHLRDLERRLPDRLLNWGIHYVKPSRLKWRWIDFKRSRAMCDPCSEQSVRLNAVTRDPQGCVSQGQECLGLCEKIEEKLRQVEDPVTGESFVERVWRGAELYPGRFSDRVSDLIFETVREEVAFSQWFQKGELFSEPRSWRGVHSVRGIVILSGHGIAGSASLPSQSILDIAPTVLHLFGLPIPTSMTGSVIADAVIDGGGPEQRVDMVDASSLHSDHGEPLDPSLAQRLEGLGYLG